MNKRSLTAVAAVTSMLFTVGAARAEVSVGDAAPAFKLVGSDGKTYTNKDFNGEKVVVIAWFPKAFTGGCTKECKSLRDNAQALQNYKVAFFTASVDPVEKNTDFAKSLELNYPILSDPTKTLAKSLGCLNDRGTTNRWTYYIGKDNKILFVDKNVKAAEHGAAIIKKLEELGVEKK